MFKKLFSLLLAAALIMSSFSVFAIDKYGGYPIQVDISVNGSFIKCAQKPIMVENSTYIPLRAFSDAIGATISWDAKESAATITKGNHCFVFYSGRDYCYINGEQTSHKAIEYKDLLFVPVRAMTTALGYGVEWDSAYLTVKITAGNISVPENCRDYSYTYEDMLYLARITQIECGSQPFATKLGVANTVMNRVRSNQFPNSVKGVIFDTKYGTQFPPAHTSSFNITPSKSNMLAAKCALNGINNVSTSLYFTSKTSAPNSWAHKNRTHYTTIGNICFYL